MPLAAIYRICEPNSMNFLTQDHYAAQADAEAAASSLITSGTTPLPMICVLGLVSQVSLSTTVTDVGS
jgi:hypothetical protein